MKILLAAALTESAILAASIDLHRGLVHRSLTIHPFAPVFRTILGLTTRQSRQEDARGAHEGRGWEGAGPPGTSSQKRLTGEGGRAP